MKKVILSLVLMAIVASGAFAVSSPQTQTSAGTQISATVNIAYQANTQIDIMSLIAISDKAGSVITVQRGAATGVTTNYTTLGTIAVGAASLNLFNNAYPLIAIPKNYCARILLDATTANSLMVTYGRK